jgi:topoisomerase (DNA) II binding protein 1
MWKHALENRVRLTPRADESINVTPQDVQKGEIVVSSEATDYFENLRKKLRLDESEVEGQNLWNTEAECSATASPLEPRKPPFHGVVAFIHKKIEDQRSELVKAVETLGGRVRFQHCEEVTHFVYQGKLAASKEIRSAKEWHQKFVSPQWILDCEDASMRLEESSYPPSLNPKMALSLNFNSQPAPPSSCTQKRRPVNSNETDTPRILNRKRLASNSEPRENDLPETNEKQQNLAVPDIEEEACKELLQLDQVLSRSAEQIPLPKVANVSVARNGRGNDHVFVPATQPLELADSQSAPIAWDLHETQKPTGSQPAYAQTYRVMFSGMALDDRDSCTAIIEKLGGTVLEANHYDPTCTHLVVAKVGSNEKLLTSIAAGKWILNPEWLNASEKEHRFLDESKFEWGNPKATVDYPQSESITEDEANIAAAAYYWRINRNRGLSDGPFHGITAVLYLREKNASFQRLLEAGGGEVVDQR